MTITSSVFCSVNAAHEASPMKGGIVQLSTDTFTSLRGAVTLKTPSLVLSAPFKPMICSTLAVSSVSACDDAASREKRQRNRSEHFMSCEHRLLSRCFKLAKRQSFISTRLRG